MWRKIFFWPKNQIVLAVPLVLLIGFFAGLALDTSPLTKLILPVTVLMIYPTMIGFQPNQLLNLSHSRLMAVSLGLNFLIVPLLAFAIGTLVLTKDPQLFAGLAISALLPTSNMTIAFTMLAKGNVPAAVKLTVLSLIGGALLAPWYLLVMVGQYIPIDVMATMGTIALVVFLPMIMGLTTYKLLLTRYTQQDFNMKIKPVLPALSTWGMVFIIFTSISMNAHRILNHLEILGLAIIAQLIFYLCNYALAVFVAKRFFNREDGYVLVYGTVLRNLSISLGLAATSFGPNAALMVTIAFLMQQQGAAWFIKLNDRFNFLPPARDSATD